MTNAVLTATPLALARPPLVRVRSFAFWVLCAYLLFGVWTLWRDFGATALAFPAVTAVNVAVLAATLAGGMWLARRVLRPVQAPPYAASWLAVGWGGLAATGLALHLNGLQLSVLAEAAGLEFAGRWGAALTAPVDEETVKVLGVVMLAAVSSRVVRGAADGLVFGALVGLGFQVAENLIYGFNQVAATGGVGSTAAAVEVLAVRVIGTGYGSHWAMTAVAGAGIGYLVGASGRPLSRRLLVALGCWMLAMAMHFQFDSPFLEGAVWETFLKPVVNLVVVMAVFIVVRRRFLARWREVCAEETASGALREGEARVLSRRHARRKSVRGLPSRPRLAVERLQAAQLELLEGRVPDMEPAAAFAPSREAIARLRTAITWAGPPRGRPV
jgi:RsiW-degrading membrane proteinase PrsW (M82 family)